MYVEGKNGEKNKSTTTAKEMAVTGGACHNDQACMTHVLSFSSYCGNHLKMLFKPFIFSTEYAFDEKLGVPPTATLYLG